MAANSANFTPGADWTDIFASAPYNALSNQKITVQSVGFAAVRLFAGGAAAPADPAQGFTLINGASWTGTTDHLWVRSGGNASLAIGTED